MMNNFDYPNKKKTGAELVSELEEKIARYSKVSHYVLILGERGTGKTTLAKQLHEQGGRANKEFVNLNCASLSAELLEAELFGYEKGAFTGASAPKMGLFEIAHGGTLFLDEIGEIPLILQAKLLKAVEEKRIRRVGSNTERIIDTRIIAATSQNLSKMAEQGEFRADLYDRLNILTLETVPLRFQKEKIKELLHAGLSKECAATGRTSPFEISAEAFALLESYEWGGNFRELHNTATRLAVECLDDEIISAEGIVRVLGISLPATVKKSRKSPQIKPLNQPGKLISVTFDPQNDDLDQIYLKAAGSVIQHVLSENGGNLRRAAQTLGATRQTISRLFKLFNENTDGCPNQLSEVKQFAAAR